MKNIKHWVKKNYVDGHATKNNPHTECNPNQILGAFCRDRKKKQIKSLHRGIKKPIIEKKT